MKRSLLPKLFFTGVAIAAASVAYSQVQPDGAIVPAQALFKEGKVMKSQPERGGKTLDWKASVASQGKWQSARVPR